MSKSPFPISAFSDHFPSWEYPNHRGIGCNAVNPADTTNFLSFLQELRKHPVGSKLTLSAATAISPFIGPDGNSFSDVSAFSQVLDYVAIMNYDIWGSWSPNVGPNAPLNDSCVPEYQGGSAVSAVRAWNQAGIPLNQLVLGVPAYGHAYRVSPSNAFEDPTHERLALYPTVDTKNQPAGDSWDDPTGEVDVCGNTTTAGGTWNFWGLIQAGYLTPNGSVAQGISSRFDECSQTVSGLEDSFSRLDIVLIGCG